MLQKSSKSEINMAKITINSRLIVSFDLMTLIRLGFQSFVWVIQVF